ncbi:MAG TPA: hypothetical protein DCZ01_10405 [Elusimicrobia bacterium]|nr:hypothetical protein [Elusimicrobiota bacterium]
MNALSAVAIGILFIFSHTPLSRAEDTQDHFRFVITGCAHLGICDSKDFESTIDDMRKSGPAFALFLGGMVDPAVVETGHSTWQRLDALIRKLGVPVHQVCGGCSLTPISASKKGGATAEECGRELSERGYYSFEYRNNLFIALDSANVAPQEDAGQLDFLRKTLGHASGYRNVFVFTNKVLWLQNEWEHWQEAIHPLLRGKVSYVFGSGVHFLDSRKIDDVTYIAAGSPMCRSLHFARPSFPHFLIVDVDKSEATIRIQPTEPLRWENLGHFQDDDTLPTPLLDQTVGLRQSILKTATLDAAWRTGFLDPPRVMEILRIQPNMNILDIGAGSGLFSFRFAEALNGTGKVFATDTDAMMVEYLKRKAKERGHVNVLPILVKTMGLDLFSQRYSFDIIFLSDVYYQIPHPEEYFRRLRSSLVKVTGRLYIIQPKGVSIFSDGEFDDFNKVVKILLSEGKEFPLFRRLAPAVKSFLRDWKGELVPIDMRSAIIADLNAMLPDRRLWNDLTQYYYEKRINGTKNTPLKLIRNGRDISLLKWLIVSLDMQGVFSETDTDAVLREEAARDLRKLNRILIENIFDLQRLRWIEPASVVYEAPSIVATMKTSGYAFVRSHDILPHYDLLEFKTGD